MMINPDVAGYAKPEITGKHLEKHAKNAKNNNLLRTKKY